MSLSIRSTDSLSILRVTGDFRAVRAQVRFLGQASGREAVSQAAAEPLAAAGLAEGSMVAGGGSGVFESEVCMTIRHMEGNNV